LEVRWALHRIGADLGEPLEIRASGEALVVTGTLDDPTRRDRVKQAVRGLPQVSTDLKVTAADADSLAGAQPIGPAATAESPLLAQQLLRDRPDSDARSAFISDAVHLSHSVLRHSWALERLAKRYPRSSQEALQPKTRASLQQLAAAHETAIRAALRRGASLWRPYVELNAAPAGEKAGGRLLWQESAPAILQAAQEFDHATQRLLSASASDGLQASDALRLLRENQQKLWSSLEGR